MQLMSCPSPNHAGDGFWADSEGNKKQTGEYISMEQKTTRLLIGGQGFNWGHFTF